MDWEAPDVPVEKGRDLFITLGKTIRAHQLYDERNPVYQRFVANLRAGFEELWPEVDSLVALVEENRLVWEGHEVYRNENRSDSLAFLFYKDGIREITFLPGIEEEELLKLLGVLRAARNISPEGDDLLTILWEADLDRFRYSHLEVLVEGVEMPDVGGGAGTDQLTQVLAREVEEATDEAPSAPPGGEEGEEVEEGEEEAEAARAGSAPPEAPPKGQVSTEDFNPTLYSLDSRELERLRKEIEEEMSRDLRKDVLSALFDRLEDAPGSDRQEEILDILGTLLPNFLSRGALRSAGRVVAALRALVEEEEVLDAERRALADQILDVLSGDEALLELVRALEDGSVSPDPEELSSFLRHLKVDALGPLVRASEETDDEAIGEVIRTAVRGIAERSPAAVIELLGSSDPVVAAGACRLAGEIRVPDAGRAVAKLLEHSSPEVRLAAVDSTVRLEDSAAAEALLDALRDPDRKVRIAVARALADLEYPRAAERLREVVTGKAIRDADITEKVAFFESYGELGGEEAVSLLDKLLNGRSFLGRREPEEIRASAALALGRVDTEAARGALEKARDEDSPVIRSAVNRAFRGERGRG